MMTSSHPHTFFLLVVLLASSASLLQSQQPYQGIDAYDCSNTTTTTLGYLCRSGRFFSCQAFLTFHSRPPYQTVSNISALFSSDPSLLSLSNSVPDSATFPLGLKVFVPVNCSCSGAGRYRSISSYTVQPGDTEFVIADRIYQGLSTCGAVQSAGNRGSSSSSGFLVSGLDIDVPLRCACPNGAQRQSGVKYLASYLVDKDDSLFSISQWFHMTEQSILQANKLFLSNATIYPFTTLLVPLKKPPQNIRHYTTASPQIQPPHQTPVPPPSPPPPVETSDHIWLNVVIGVAAAAVALAAFSFIFLCLSLKTKRVRDDGTPAHDEENIQVSASLQPPQGTIRSDIGIKVYSFQELQTATMNFSSQCRIHGSVYRAAFNGDAAAVKIMKRDVSWEIEIFKKTNHFNLVRLTGICFNKCRWYLVYSYAQNGSLSNWIFDGGRERSPFTALSWAQRVQIALDAANGLNYLHTYTSPPYVHKDIKSSNILLDDKFRAKVANLGRARPARDKQGSLELTRHIVGTKGYMAPEYLELGLVSLKLDVYAFGVVMMEMITGKDVINVQGRRGSSFSLEAFIAALCEEDAGEKLGGFIDPLLEGKYPLDQALNMSGLIERCLSQDPVDRPTMDEISQSLLKINVASQSWELWKDELPSYATETPSAE